MTPGAAAPSDRQAGSVSCGSANRGGLGRPAELAVEGEGWIISSPWRERGFRFGTDELVGAIASAAAAVAARHPGFILGVADLSRDRGGALRGHRSHQSGRDVDLLYYAVDAAGRPVAPDDALPFYRGDRRATHARAPAHKRIATRWFDADVNWTLVAALATDTNAGVERIFVSLRVHRWLMAAGARRGANSEAERRAVAAVLRVGKAGQRHGDHLHVRIRCTEDDIRHGLCRPYLAPNRKSGDKWRWGIRCPR